VDDDVDEDDFEDDDENECEKREPPKDPLWRSRRIPLLQPASLANL
jgi:hypothetical protein